MKTFIKIFAIVIMLCQAQVYAQKISFENINSTNAMLILSQIQSTANFQKNAGVSTIQYGNNNYAGIDTNSKTILSAAQIGGHNYLNFDNSTSKNRVRSSINTVGYNNIIDIVGSNSISEKLQLTVKGDNMTIFMRNYK